MTLALNDPAGPATFITTLEDLRQPGRLRVVKVDSDRWLHHYATHPEQRPFLIAAIHRTWRAAGYQLVRMTAVSATHIYSINLSTYKLEPMYAGPSYSAYPSEGHRDEQHDWRVEQL